MGDKSGALQGAVAGQESSGSATLFVDAGRPIGTMRTLQGAAGMPGPGPRRRADSRCLTMSGNPRR